MKMKNLSLRVKCLLQPICFTRCTEVSTKLKKSGNNGCAWRPWYKQVKSVLTHYICDILEYIKIFSNLYEFSKIYNFATVLYGIMYIKTSCRCYVVQC